MWSDLGAPHSLSLSISFFLSINISLSIASSLRSRIRPWAWRDEGVTFQGGPDAGRDY